MRNGIVDKFNKITVGFVIQTFEKSDEGRFICVGQEFIAGDQVDYEDGDGNCTSHKSTSRGIVES